MTTVSLATPTPCTSRLPLAHGSMPSVGLGCWKVDKDIAADTVEAAIKMGYRHIDSASDYGNEKEVGEGIKRALEAGVCTRDELFVTSKLWNTYHSSQHVELACRRSLEDLGLSYLDLYLIHFPISLEFVPFSSRYPPGWLEPGTQGLRFANVPVSETWAAMEALVRTGLVKDIGVSNWGSQGLRDLLAHCTIKPSVLQIELHPFLQCNQLVAWAKEQGIQVTAFSPLGNGESYSMLGFQWRNSLNQSIIKRISGYLGVQGSQVVLRWGLQRGYAVIPKSTNKDHLEANLNLEGFTLTERHMELLADLDKGERFNDPGFFCPKAFGTKCPIWD